MIGFSLTINDTRPHLANDFSDHHDPFLEKCFYQQTPSYADSISIQTILKETTSVRDLLVYLAIPPDVFGDASQAIATQRYKIPGFCRIVLEKPFGRDTASCQILLGTLQRQGWKETNLFRIDHYLGKTLVRSILRIRTQSIWLERIWNAKAIQSVHMQFKEPFGTDGRGGYFDSYGIIRDVIQNHLLQVMSLLAMNVPCSTDNDSIRDAKVQLLRSIPMVRSSDCLLGQYEAYPLDETIQNKNTKCPTYACVAMRIHTKRWGGVPFVLEAGKALDEQLCEVRVALKSKLGSVVFRIQPHPSLRFCPGVGAKQQEHHLGDNLDMPTSDNAYAELLLHALKGKHQSFVRDDELMEAWRIFSPLLKDVESQTPEHYHRGTTGPTSRNVFLAAKGIDEAVTHMQSAL